MTEKERQIRNEKEYRGLTMRLGASLLIFLGIFSISQTIYLALDAWLPEILNAKTAYLISNLLYAGMYLASFMVPVAFFRLFSKGKRTEPMGLQMRLPAETPLLIIATVGIVFAAAWLNNLIISPFISPNFDFSEAFVSSDYSSNYKIVVQFIAVALVPGVCEEFLFRGLILSSLAPYGKTGAVIASAVLFGLMHQNPMQMLYTTVAGIVLGLLYLYTGSIWCSMLAHILNNGISVFEEVLIERLPEERLWIVTVFEILIFLLAAASVLFLLLRRGARFTKRPDFRGGVFGSTPSEAEGYQRVPVAPARKIRLFFAPTMIVFLVLSVFQMAALMIALMVGTS